MVRGAQGSGGCTLLIESIAQPQRDLGLGGRGWLAGERVGVPGLAAPVSLPIDWLAHSKKGTALLGTKAQLGQEGLGAPPGRGAGPARSPRGEERVSGPAATQEYVRTRLASQRVKADHPPQAGRAAAPSGGHQGERSASLAAVHEARATPECGPRGRQSRGRRVGSGRAARPAAADQGAA